MHKFMKAFLTLLCLMLMVTTFTGCATGPRVDWESRIGHYSYDQAVLELGPPDKLAQLSDGSRVAEWLTSPGGARGGTIISMGRFSQHYLSSATADYYLRLTFDPQGNLMAWRNVAR